MAIPLLNATPSSTNRPTPGRERASLMRLYLTRGVLALVWAALFAGAHQTLDAIAIALLVIYPVIDAVSSLIDYRAVLVESERGIAAFNGVLSSMAAIALGVAATSGVVPALAVFGLWAMVSGAAQLLLGLRRRGQELGKQWPMLLAGGLSFLVGISYAIQAAGPKPSLDVLSVYATGGGIFFLVQAGLLSLRTRQRRAGALLR